MAATPKPPPPPPPLFTFKGTVVGVNVADTPLGHPDVEVAVRGPDTFNREATRLCWRCDPLQAPKVGAMVTVTVEAV